MYTFLLFPHQPRGVGSTRIASFLHRVPRIPASRALKHTVRGRNVEQERLANDHVRLLKHRIAALEGTTGSAFLHIPTPEVQHQAGDDPMGIQQLMPSIDKVPKDFHLCLHCMHPRRPASTHSYTCAQRAGHDFYECMQMNSDRQ